MIIILIIARKKIYSCRLNWRYILDTKYTGNTCFISNDEFCVEELIDSKKMLSRYKITADKAEQVWSIDVEQVCGEK